MSLINLFWQLDITDETKYLLIFFLVICVIAVGIYNKKQKKKPKKESKNYNANLNSPFQDHYYNEYQNKRNNTKCHEKYMNCVENNIKNGTDEFCYPCLNGGKKPDFFYDGESGEWILRENN
jgi:hypothetical protein